jgi:muramoyltetrapeptide carboxypeptidase
VLRENDAVAVVAPCGPFDRPSFERGLAVLAQRYRPVFTERLFDAHRYLAGTDAARLAELQGALDDAAVKAVFLARGGYGAMRLLPSLRPGAPRPLVGFSDATALHLRLQAAGWRTLHAPVLTQLGKQPPDVIARLFDLLEGRPVAPLPGTRTVVPGVAEGRLLGGNLSVLTRLLGTPYLPSLKGAVLLLEDVGERPYRLDRMWTHLVLAGALDGVAGIVFGEFTGCEEKDAPYSSADVLDELAQALGVPCASGFPIGHGDINVPVPLGARVRLDADRQTLTCLEGLFP